MTSIATASEARAEKKAAPVEPRRDIQGLRALAVTAVILNHLTEWPGGGFVGVDAFFVISGFLITGLLIRRREKTGRISARDFYKRRAKRILPAATLVLVVTTVASALTYNATKAASVRTDAVWAFFFASNWHFKAVNTDYFAASATPSPLQHFWSLSIEEQFYFVWPWLMAATFAAVLGRRASYRTARTVVFVVLAVLTVASFAWALRETSTNVSGAYFSTFSRVWELGVGALCAVAAPAFHGLPDRIRPLLAWVGLLGLTASLFVVSSSSGFPAPWAALPVVSTAVVIVAGTHADRGWQQPFMWPLTNPGSNYVGDTSYSLYLWHFPVIIIGEALIGATAGDKAVLAVTLVALAVFSFHLVEDPIRRSKIGDMGRRRRRRRLRARHYFPATSAKVYSRWLLAFVACVAAVSVAAALRPIEDPKTINVAPPSDRPTGDADPLSPELAKLQKSIGTAVRATTWPDLDPSFDDVLAGPSAPDDVHSCGTTPHVDPVACTWGDPNAPKTAVVVGDSVSVLYTVTIRKMLLDRGGWQVHQYGGFGCAFTDGTVEVAVPEIQEACSGRVDDAVAAIKDLRPDLLFVAHTALPSTLVGEDEPMSDDEWAQHTGDLLKSVAGSVGEIVVVAAPPPDKALSDCYTPGSAPADCVGDVTGQWAQRSVAEQTMAKDVGGTWLGSELWFCYEGYCPAFADGIVTKYDTTHMTGPYAERLAPVMDEALVDAGVFGR